MGSGAGMMFATEVGREYPDANQQVLATVTETSLHNRKHRLHVRAADDW